jgi:hypothetical protein
MDNYQFCHGYMGKDLLEMTQEKLIQAFGRVGRSNTQMDYTIRLRNDDFINKVFYKEDNKKEVANMNRLFGYDIKNMIFYDDDDDDDVDDVDDDDEKDKQKDIIKIQILNYEYESPETIEIQSKKTNQNVIDEGENNEEVNKENKEILLNYDDEIEKEFELMKQEEQNKNLVPTDQGQRQVNIIMPDGDDWETMMENWE